MNDIYVLEPGSTSADATNREVILSSSDLFVASVNASGALTGSTFGFANKFQKIILLSLNIIEINQEISLLFC